MAPGSTMLVCELMEGGSVHDLVRRGALTWAEGGLDIAKDVARGLSYLHNNRIAHLDIKSGNVLLTRCAPDPKNPMPPKYPKLKTLETRTLPDLGRGRAGHRRGRRARPLLPAQQPHRPLRHQVRQRAAHAVGHQPWDSKTPKNPENPKPTRKVTALPTTTSSRVRQPCSSHLTH